MKLLIRNGMIATDSAVFPGDILIEDGKIKAVGESLDRECFHSAKEKEGADPLSSLKSSEEVQVIDAKGSYVLPGGVDVHTHMDLNVGFARAIDDFYTGTVAAACGGTTTIVDHMAFGPKDCSLWHQVDEYHRLADGNAVIDYGFHGVLQHWHPQTAAEMKEIAEKEGITSFKAYLTYDYRIEDEDMLPVLKEAKKDGLVIAVHCENHGAIQYLRKTYVEEGKTQARFHPLSRPAACEAEAVNRLIHLAAMAGDAPCYIVHLSSKEGLKELQKARAEHQKGLGAETCTQYLTLTDDLYQDPQEGLKAIMSPPLRKKEDQEALWQALADGTIDVVATDHCPFHFKEGKAEKQYGADDFTKCPNGAPGVQERIPVMFSEGFMKGRISLPQLVRLCCTNPCRMYGMYPQKGTIQPGSDADLIIIDPNKEYTFTAHDIAGASDYTCYEGFKLKGRIELVMQRGKILARDGKFLGRRGDGCYLKRGKSQLAE